MEALRLQGIGKSFGAFTALRDIDLTIRRGEFVCFLGPSGCGKTTLLRIIAGLERQSTGSIRQDGRDVSHLPPAARDYGIVFQSYALFPNLTIEENVGYGLVSRRHTRAQVKRRVDELLALVGLPEAGPKYPSQCSGGQQQRIALARALAASPGLLLLDEPLSALDAKVRERLRGELRGLQRQLGVTTIMVTHDQEEALSLADRVVVMNQGAIDQVGTPLEVYERAATPFVAAFLGRINALEALSLGNGVYRIGAVELRTGVNGVPGGERVRLYLRPEDRYVEGEAPCGAEALHGRVSRFDFLGTYCLAEVAGSALGQPVLLYYSLNQMHDLKLREGAQVAFALRGERARVFGAAAEAPITLAAAA
jgi:iron(III) transport system ATP-binding protein